ncbi:hypothetical protein C8R44DRAFT_942943 [Mycena epipterygia]|nr:hypothetical protein C8R44DRAFT_942943 [Mycena epipterygia]
MACNWVRVVASFTSTTIFGDSNMAPSCLPVQELWDHIIDLLRGSPKDLKTCSLVCRSFVARAQSHTFRQILFHDANRELASRVATVLSASPHIISYVRFLFIGRCDTETVSPLAQVPWSNVDSMTFTNFTVLTPGGVALECVRELVSLPCLRNLSIHGDKWTAEQLFSVFAHCTRGLERINFYNCVPEPSPAPPIPQEVQRPKIRQLSVVHGVEIGGLLRDPACPLDFSALTEVYFAKSMSRSVEALLFCARFTIERIHFCGKDETMHCLDLSLFPALKHIKCIDVGPTFHHLFSTLSSNNAVDTLRIVLFGMDIGVIDLQPVESTIFAVKMAPLRRVEVEVATSPFLVSAREPEMANMVNAGLPRLRDSALLHIRFV